MERNREQKEAEVDHKIEEERRYKQAQIKRQMELDKNQVKLLET